MQGDDQVNDTGPAEVRRLPQPEDFPSEEVRRRVSVFGQWRQWHRVRTRTQHNGQSGVPLPESGGRTRPARRRCARRRSLGTCAQALLGHCRRLRAQRVRRRRVDRQVHVPAEHGLTTAAAVNRRAPESDDAATAAISRPRFGRTVNINFCFIYHFNIRYTNTQIHIHANYTMTTEFFFFSEFLFVYDLLRSTFIIFYYYR